jgi:hypothetical protein
MHVDTLSVLLNVAADSSRKALERYIKKGAAGTARGGSSLRVVRGPTATSSRGNVKDVLNQFHIPQVIVCCIMDH